MFEIHKFYDISAVNLQQWLPTSLTPWRSAPSTAAKSRGASSETGNLHHAAGLKGQERHLRVSEHLMRAILFTSAVSGRPVSQIDFSPSLKQSKLLGLTFKEWNEAQHKNGVSMFRKQSGVKVFCQHAS